MFIRYVFTCAALSFLLICLNVNAAAQREDAEFRPTPVMNCEDVEQQISAANVLSEGRNIIVISRLGNGERGDKLHDQRLKAIVTNFEKAWSRKPESIITARGERNNGLGRLELYVDGRLLVIIEVRKRKPLKPYCNFDV